MSCPVKCSPNTLLFFFFALLKCYHKKAERQTYKKQQYVNAAAVPLLCEKPSVMAVSGEALLSQRPYCSFPNALCAISPITECVGCNSYCSFIQTFFCVVKLSVEISLGFCRASPTITSK